MTANSLSPMPTRELRFSIQQLQWRTPNSGPHQELVFGTEILGRYRAFSVPSYCNIVTQELSRQAYFDEEPIDIDYDLLGQVISQV